MDTLKKLFGGQKSPRSKYEIDSPSSSNNNNATTNIEGAYHFSLNIDIILLL